MPTLNEFSTVLAYQRAPLAEMQKLYENLQFDLHDYLRQEDELAQELRRLEQNYLVLCQSLQSQAPPSEIQKKLASAVLDVNGEQDSAKKYARITIESGDTFEQLLKQAEQHLHNLGIEIDRDPLLQILDSGEIAEIRSAYRRKYQEVEWQQEDYIVIVLAGIMATLTDLLLMKIPGSDGVLRSLPQGYALTKWLQTRSRQLQARPYPQTEADDLLPPLDSERDPLFELLCFLRQNSGASSTPQQLSEAGGEQETSSIRLALILLRLFSTVFRSAGMEPPFGRLISLIRPDASSAEHKKENSILKKQLADYLEQQGFKPKELLMLGVVPAAVDLMIKGYWLLKHFDAPEQEEDVLAKLPSMLVLGHTIALSGNLLKTGLLYQLNPLALNWRRLVEFSPVLLAWIVESLEHDRRIRTQMDQEWLRLHDTIKGLMKTTGITYRKE